MEILEVHWTKFCILVFLYKNPTWFEDVPLTLVEPSPSNTVSTRNCNNLLIVYNKNVTLNYFLTTVLTDVVSWLCTVFVSKQRVGGDWHHRLLLCWTWSRYCIGFNQGPMFSVLSNLEISQKFMFGRHKRKYYLLTDLNQGASELN